MNAQHHYQILQHRGMNQLTSIAQSHHRNIDQQVTQIEELQATITAKDEVIAQRDKTITHREDQILESDTVIIQRNTIIEFLQEQVHDLTLELDDAIAHINVLHEQPAPPNVPEEPESEDEGEDPEEIEEISDLDFEHGDPEPNPQPNHSSSGSQPSVGNLDDF
jgi:chromosome segregation ATPase